MCSTPKSHHLAPHRTHISGNMMSSAAMARFSQVANAAEERRQERQRQSRLKSLSTAHGTQAVSATEVNSTQSTLFAKLWRVLNVDLVKFFRHRFTIPL